MAEAAKIVEASEPDALDINMGCPVKKVMKTGAGAALMGDLGRARAVMASVRASVSIPVTVKMRSGHDASGKEALFLAEAAQDCGMDAVTLHPRTIGQGFSGEADRRLIAGVKKKVKIPVVGNGDVRTAKDAIDMMEQTGCDFVMIGRAAMSNPWIFSQAVALFSGREAPVPGPEDRRRVMERFLSDSVSLFGEKRACLMMRSRLAWFVGGLAGAAAFRESVHRLETRDQALEKIGAFFRGLRG
jgi:nifR3 family TIM-barrel protein